MTAHPQLKPASELAKNNGVRFPNESSDYRIARDKLLAEEIELRRHIERVTVKDIKAAVQWYAKVVGRPADSTAMPKLAEWEFINRDDWSIK